MSSFYNERSHCGIAELSVLASVLFSTLINNLQNGVNHEATVVIGSY